MAYCRAFSNTPQSVQSVCVISGGSRGIGLEFVRQIVQSSKQSNPTTKPSSNIVKVLALSRNKSPELDELISKHPESIEWYGTDLTSQDSVNQTTEKIVNRYSYIELLVNSAGVLGGNSNTNGPERSILNLDKDWMSKTFETNLFGHVMLTKGLIPLFKTSSSNSNKETVKVSKIVNISARVGSIDDNKLGGWYSYRMSKAALNMFTKTLAIEMKRYKCGVISIHPGTTDTDLSKPFQKNVQANKLFSTEYSVQSMLKVIEDFKLEDSGSFYAYDGNKIPF